MPCAVHLGVARRVEGREEPALGDAYAQVFREHQHETAESHLDGCRRVFRPISGEVQRDIADAPGELQLSEPGVPEFGRRELRRPNRQLEALHLRRIGRPETDLRVGCRGLVDESGQRNPPELHLAECRSHLDPKVCGDLLAQSQMKETVVVTIELDVHVPVVTETLEADLESRRASVHGPVALGSHAGRIVLEMRVVQETAVCRRDSELSRDVLHVHGHGLDVADLPPGPDLRPVGLLGRERCGGGEKSYGRESRPGR